MIANGDIVFMATAEGIVCITRFALFEKVFLFVTALVFYECENEL